MPRTLPAALTSAMDDAVFKAYIAIGKRNYTGTPPASLASYSTLITKILYYQYDGQKLTVKYASANLPADDGLIVGAKYFLERGVTIAGVNHTIKSASLRFDDYEITKQIITAQFSLFSNDEKPTAVAGDDTYTNVLTALNPNSYYLGTVDFKTTPENTAHWGYNFYPAGKQVSLKSYASLLPLIKQKYLLETTDNSDDDNEDEIQFFHLRSPTGSLSWTSADTTADQHFAVCWSPELSLFAACGTSNVYTSPDGVTWTKRTGTNLALQGICWAPALGLFVGVGSGGGNYATTSPDGINWTDRAGIAPDTSWHAIVWSPELALLVAVGGSKIITSADGINWAAQTADANVWQGVCWSPELSLFVAVAGSGANRVTTSPDGTTWTARSASEANDWIGITWSAEVSLFVAVADSGTNRVMTSPTGVTWTARSAAAANQWRSVCYSSTFGLFIAVAATGTGDRLMTSATGTAWTSSTTGHDSDWYGIVWSPELEIFVTVATAGATRIAATVASMTADHTITQGDITLLKDAVLNAFLWRDENATINTNGAAESPIHNLGYLESTDQPPASFTNSDRARVTVGIHLKYKTGDIFTLQITASQTATYLAHVTEILDPDAEIGWRNEIELIERFSNTNAGAMPSTIERVAAYTPLVTSGFDGNLDATVNNLQALAEKVDSLILGTTAADITYDGGTGMSATDVEAALDELANEKANSADLPTLASGTYTPTLNNVTNIASATAGQWNYIRIGAHVFLNGKLTITTTAAGAFTIRVSIPVASNFSAVDDANGNATQPGTGTPNVGSFREDQTNNDLQLDGYAQVNTQLVWRCMAGYIIK